MLDVMSAKSIAVTYFDKIRFITSVENVDGIFYITDKQGNKIAIHETSIQTIRHHLTNYSDVCRELIDNEKLIHSDKFLNNIISKFRELVNDLVFRSCVSLYLEK